MLLYQNSILLLEYDPATDILELAWPDLEPSVLPEVKQAFQVLMEAIVDYDVKKLLVDCSKATVSIPDDENTSLMLKLAQDLNTTRLQKIARIASSDAVDETRAEESLMKIQQNPAIHFQLQNFSDRTSAMEWLKSAS
ncbi:hypothetical protein ACFSC6_19875 [Rufibacter sediminis]|uniref:STAS/SEC14 domain-containing protein n=1 Tax=Rufibacter sediminis TaxID=2762756 RepID=A0ABR6VNI9_9BACT|nr:hypothetical protein [Rufibacter sediminis]MBC3538708.1 hypothetical protein [Rufibacter sediminis]